METQVKVGFLRFSCPQQVAEHHRLKKSLKLCIFLLILALFRVVYLLKSSGC